MLYNFPIIHYYDVTGSRGLLRDKNDTCSGSDFRQPRKTKAFFFIFVIFKKKKCLNSENFLICIIIPEVKYAELI